MCMDTQFWAVPRPSVKIKSREKHGRDETKQKTAAVRRKKKN